MLLACRFSLSSLLVLLQLSLIRGLLLLLMLLMEPVLSIILMLSVKLMLLMKPLLADGADATVVVSVEL